MKFLHETVRLVAQVEDAADVNAPLFRIKINLGGDGRHPGRGMILEFLEPGLVAGLYTQVVIFGLVASKVVSFYLTVMLRVGAIE